MADINTIRVGGNLIRNNPGLGCQVDTKVYAVPNALAALNQGIALWQAPYALRVVDVDVQVSGTLGATVTVTPRRNTNGVTATGVAIAPATTAGAASAVAMNVAPFTLNPGDELELLVGGAAIGAAATVTLDVTFTQL